MQICGRGVIVCICLAQRKKSVIILISCSGDRKLQSKTTKWVMIKNQTE